MRESLTARIAGRMENMLAVLSPERAVRRRQFRFAYDALANHRTHESRTRSTGRTGDSDLDEASLDRLREICRDLGRNNPLVKGLLLTEADDVVGTDTQIQVRTEDEGWNKAAEAIVKETMIDRTCDVTGRFNLHKLLHLGYLSYRRDGDAFMVFADDGPQLIEGHQCGTPTGKQTKAFDIINGVAVAKKTQRLLGYYIGLPNKWGYIAAETWTQYPAGDVFHIFNPDRASFTRGEPVLTPSVTWIDKLFRYADAELVAAVVNAALAHYVTINDNGRVPTAWTKGRYSDGKTNDNQKVEKIEPGMIKYLNQGEGITAVTPNRPAAAFDPFMLRMLMIVCRPLCMPLMVGTLDFSGATFMNARIAYQAAQKNYRREQAHIVIPWATRIARWRLDKAIADGDLTARETYGIEIKCQRWPYVDPYRESQANKNNLDAGITTAGTLIEEAGGDYRAHCERVVREAEIRKKTGVDAARPQPPEKPEASDDDGK
ncbi:MAG: phage portal protein [Deltaproteobacteria bacterium]|nr:phage portal protein [Deltaproteobacteria bacterium]